MKPRHLLLGAALLASAALVAFGDRGAGAGIAEAVERPAAHAALIGAPRVTPARVDQTAQDHAGAETGAEGQGQPVLALAPRTALVGGGDTQFAQAGQAAGADASPGGALFARQDWTPPPAPAASAPPPPPPSAPPLPFTVIGKSLADGVWEVYLARGEQTYLVHDKDLIDGTYRVDAIAPPRMTLTYLPLNQVQQLNIGVFD